MSLFTPFKYIQVLILSIGLTGAVFAQAQPNTGAAPATNAPVEAVPPPSVKADKGLRFVFATLPQGTQNLYMIVNAKENAKIPVMKGVLSNRVPFPESRVVHLYDQPAVGGRPVGNKFLSVPLPRSISDRMIGVITMTEKGPGIFFLSERSFKTGMVIFRNLAPHPVMISLGENQPFQIQPNQEHIFTPGYKDGGKSNIHGAKLYGIDDEDRPYVSRQFAVQVRKLDAELVLITWDDHTQRNDISKITVAPEYVFVPKKPQPGQQQQQQRRPSGPRSNEPPKI